MSEFFKKHKIILKTIGPVFIGSGQTLVKKEYILNRRRGVVIVLDEKKFFKFLQEENKLKSFEKFILSENGTMQNWLNKEAVTEEAIQKFAAYKYSFGNIGDIRNLRDLKTFIKDAYGRPYIPGSSIKGALRTAILGADMIRNRDKYVEIVDSFKRKRFCCRNDFLQKEDVKGIENKRFSAKDKTGDVMSGLKVSDSEPLSVTDLMLCQKIDMHVDGRRKELPIFRECLKPGIQIEFDLTIDSTKCDLTDKQILEDIGLFLKEYNKVFLEKFNAEFYTGNIIYLGGGAGFATKAVLHFLISENRLRNRVVSEIMNVNFPKHNHKRDIEWGVSPRTYKLAEFNGTLFQMGACSIEII